MDKIFKLCPLLSLGKACYITVFFQHNNKIFVFSTKTLFYKSLKNNIHNKNKYYDCQPWSPTMDIAPSKVDLGAMRAPYKTEASKDFSIQDPMKIFDTWFHDARSNENIREANAMAVATADRLGFPSVRYVLLKSYSKEGFVFFTNYNSRKGHDIIRIEGSVVKISEKESDDYFHSRPKGSQISTSISEQSKVIESKEVLLKKKEQMEQQYAESDVPRPRIWGGYLVVPKSFEFWCGRSDRLHDRIRFRKLQAGESADERLVHSGVEEWVYEYLSP